MLDVSSVGQPRLLDLYCAAGGAGRGYQLAGFHVTGVDIVPQPRYAGDDFIQDDALAYVESHGHEYDIVHASPPCRDHTPLTSVAGRDGSGWLLAATRGRLEKLDRPWVIENVPGSPMRADLTLCGGMFGLRTYRHRWFELSSMTIPVPNHPPHIVKTATSRRRERWAQGWNVSITGDVGIYVGPEAMGIDWMTGNELCQAIPPAYTRWIGSHLKEGSR